MESNMSNLMNAFENANERHRRELAERDERIAVLMATATAVPSEISAKEHLEDTPPFPDTDNDPGHDNYPDVPPPAGASASHARAAEAATAGALGAVFAAASSEGSPLPAAQRRRPACLAAARDDGR